jgi:uncharacterized sulfatase
MRRLNAKGKLTGPQKLFFAPTKPKEELYDLDADPHEIKNLANLPEYSDRLQCMRRVLEKWMKDTNDLGLIPEAELIEQARPGGKWSTTANPVISPPGGTFTKQATVKITCPTEGASIAYTTEDGQHPHWQLYSDPLVLKENATLRSKACRLGYEDSSEITAIFKFR